VGFVPSFSLISFLSPHLAHLGGLGGSILPRAGDFVPLPYLRERARFSHRAATRAYETKSSISRYYLHSVLDASGERKLARDVHENFFSWLPATAYHSAGRGPYTRVREELSPRIGFDKATFAGEGCSHLWTRGRS